MASQISPKVNAKKEKRDFSLKRLIFYNQIGNSDVSIPKGKDILSSSLGKDVKAILRRCTHHFLQLAFVAVL